MNALAQASEANSIQGASMVEILDLELSDEEYARLISEGRDPIIEQKCTVLLTSHLRLSIRIARWLARLSLTRFIWFFVHSPVLHARQQQHNRRLRRYQRLLDR